MDCERLQTLIKTWYLQVQDEALAPARMVSFMENHIEGCEACLNDPVVKKEVEKITSIVLPPSKIPKAVKDKEAKEKAEAEAEEVETEETEEGEETEEHESDDVDDDDDEMDPDQYEQLTDEENDV